MKGALWAVLVWEGYSREAASGQRAAMQKGWRHEGVTGKSVPGTGNCSVALRRVMNAITGRTAMWPLWLKPMESMKSK